MGDRTSEMRDRYTYTPPKTDKISLNRRLTTHEAGKTKNTSFGTPDNLLMSQIQPYLSTTNKHHRPFTT
jgi:hypothetical protein